MKACRKCVDCVAPKEVQVIHLIGQKNLLDKTTPHYPTPHNPKCPSQSSGRPEREVGAERYNRDTKPGHLRQRKERVEQERRKTKG